MRIIKTIKNQKKKWVKPQMEKITLKGGSVPMLEGDSGYYDSSSPG